MRGAGQSKSIKALGLLGRFLAVLLGLLSLLVIASVVLLPYMDVSPLIRPLLFDLRARTGLDFRLEGAGRLTLLPAPGLKLERLSLAGASSPDDTERAGPQGPLLAADSVFLSLALQGLPGRELRFEEVEIRGLRLDLRREADGRDNWSDILRHFPLGGEEAAVRTEAPLLPVLPGLSLKVSFYPNALRLVKAGGSWRDAVLERRFSVTDLALDCLAESGSLNWTLAAGAAIAQRDSVIFETALSLAGAVPLPPPSGPRPEDASGHLAAKFSLAPPSGGRADFDLRGLWRLTPGGDLLLPELRLAGEGADIGAELKFAGVFPPSGAPLGVSGRLNVAALDLPRLLGPMRRFDGSLQAALAEVSATCAFSFRDGALELSDLRGRAGEAAVEGSGRVSLLPAYSLFLDLNAQKVDANKIVGVLAPADYPPPAPRHYDNPPLVRAEPGSKSSGYEVIIRARSAKAWHSWLDDVQVRCFADKSGDDTVDISAAHGHMGRLAGSIVMGADMRMIFNAKSLDVSLFAKDLGSRDGWAGLAGGTWRMRGKWEGPDFGVPRLWNCDLDFALENAALAWRAAEEPAGQPGAKKPAALWEAGAKSLRAKGRQTLRVEFLKSGSRQYFSGTLDLAGQGVSGPWNKTGGDTASLTYEGSLDFSSKDARSVKLAGKVLAKASGRPELPWRSDSGLLLEAALNANLAADFEKKTLSLEAAAFEGHGIRLDGQAGFFFGDAPSWQASVKAASASGREFFSAWGLNAASGVEDPGPLSANLALKGGRGDWSVDVDRGTGGFGDFAGRIESLAAPGGADSLVKVDFKSAVLDLDALFPPQEPPAKASENPWDLSPLDKRDFELRLGIARLVYKKLRFTNVLAVMGLKNGRLSGAGLTAQSYDGSLALTAAGGLSQPPNGLALQLTGRLRGVKLGPATRDITGQDTLEGVLNLDSDISGIMSRNADFPRAFSGTWGFGVTEGRHHGLVGNSASTFSSAGASGSLDLGLAKTDNFHMAGALMDVKGRGWVDFVKDLISLRCDVVMAKVPSFPVELTGNLYKPEVTVRHSRILTNTITNIGGGIFDLLGGVLSLPMKAVDAVTR